MNYLRTTLALCAALFLAACGAAVEKGATDAEVARAYYQHPGPPTVTLFTVINNNSGSGAHAALMVNADQRAIFDPAGSFYHPHLPERGDVHYGMSPAAVAFYIDYHARVTYRVIEQTVVVSPEVAALAMQRIRSNGAVGKAMCASSVGAILQGVPGFENVSSTMFPKALMRDFAEIPGVTEQVHYDDSSDDNKTIAAPNLRLRPGGA